MTETEGKKTSRTDGSASERDGRPIDHRLFWCIVQRRRGRLWPIRRTHGHQFPLIKSFGLFTITPPLFHALVRLPLRRSCHVLSDTCGAARRGGTKSTRRIFYYSQENGIKCPPPSPGSPRHSCSFRSTPSFFQQ